jgi:hypothetical protein
MRATQSNRLHNRSRCGYTRFRGRWSVPNITFACWSSHSSLGRSSGAPSAFIVPGLRPASTRTFEFTRLIYWTSYFRAFVLGVTILLRAIIGWSDLRPAPLSERKARLGTITHWRLQ